MLFLCYLVSVMDATYCINLETAHKIAHSGLSTCVAKQTKRDAFCSSIGSLLGSNGEDLQDVSSLPQALVMYNSGSRLLGE